MRIRINRRLSILGLGGLILGGTAVLWRGRTPSSVWEAVWPWLVVAGAAAAHELGHAVAAWGVGVRVQGLSLDLFGARMRLAGLLSYGQELVIAAAGPFVSFAAAAIAYPFAARYVGVGVFCGASLVLGGFNLLPVGTLDGGRILRSAVAWRWGDGIAERLLRGVTAVVLTLAWLLCAYGLLRGGQMLTGFALTLCLLGRGTAWETA